MRKSTRNRLKDRLKSRPKDRSKRRSEKKSVARRTLHYFWAEIIKYKWYSLGTFISTPIMVFIRSILIPYIFAEIIGLVSNGVTETEVINVLLPKALFAVAMQIVAEALSELRLSWLWKLDLKAAYDLNELAFNAISAQSMQFHNDRFSGSLVSQTNKFSSAFERFFDLITWNVLPFVLSIIFYVIVLLPLAPLVAVALLVLVSTFMFISWLTFRNISHLNEKEAAAQNHQTGQLADMVSNIHAVKSYAREDYERRRFSTFQKKTFDAGRKCLRATISRNVWFDLVYVATTATVTGFLIVGNLWFGFSVATLVLIVTYINSAVNQLWGAGNIFREMNRIFGDAHDMTEILDLKDDVVDAPDAKPLKVKDSEIEFNHIYFKHTDAKSSIFEDFSLDVKPGERIGLVGVSGSGKTTLTKLLLRFADVDQGTITIDGQDISRATQKSLRETIAYVPQETALFHRSIADNIAYARPEATRKEIERAARLANADDFIRELPDGYKTLVGERGVKLSGGQRQRIAIARAILKDAPILVLDEATSALDSESEALIQDALEELMKNRTSIVIAHRLSTVASLNRIIVLEDGHIVEQGSHGDLLAAGGPYHRLWTRQSGSFVD